MSNDDEAILRMVDDSASIGVITFKAVTGVFFALSIISVLGRASIRIYSRRTPPLDDYFILFGTICLIVATGLLYSNLEKIYLARALALDPMLAFRAQDSKLIQAAMSYLVYLNACLTLVWTTIFSVKFSFLALFRHLVQCFNKMKYYYWFVVVFITLVWMFVASEPFILCLHFGVSSVDCASNFKSKRFYSLSVLVTCLDASTDLMIVSIPVLILRQSTLRLRQKIAVGSFMCLSLIMAIIAIVRVSKVPSVSVDTNSYQLFWIYMEASIAILMASLTGYRTMFVMKKEQKRYRERMKEPCHSWRHRRRGESCADEEMTLPQVPRATLTGMRTFIRWNNRTIASNTNAFLEQSRVATHSATSSLITRGMVD